MNVLKNFSKIIKINNKVIKIMFSNNLVCNIFAAFDPSVFNQIA